MDPSIVAFLEQWGLFVGILVATLIIGYSFNRLFRRFIRKSTIIVRNDPTNYHFLRHAITAVIYLVGFSWAVYSVPEMRTVANSLLAGAGILAVAVGFASQHALSNIISGLFIIIFKPFRVNDRLTIRDHLKGIVEDITLRHTVIRDFENRRILIPNSVISDEVIINSDFGDDQICLWLEVSISYESDIDLARSLIQEEALKHPLTLDHRSDEDKEEGLDIVRVRVIALEDFCVKLRAWIWTANNADAFSLKCDLLETVKKRFEEKGIEIPYPHRTLVQKENGKTK